MLLINVELRMLELLIHLLYYHAELYTMKTLKMLHITLIHAINDHPRGSGDRQVTRWGGKLCPLLTHTSVVMFNGLRRWILLDVEARSVGRGGGGEGNCNVQCYFHPNCCLKVSVFLFPVSLYVSCYSSNVVSAYPLTLPDPVLLWVSFFAEWIMSGVVI